jgi:2-methylcitrate dehydratase PrpD
MIALEGSMSEAVRVPTSETTLSEQLADYVTSCEFDDLPAAVVEHAKDLLINQLGLALSGRSSDVGGRAIALAHELSAGAGTSTLVGERHRVMLLDAIFAHSVLMGRELDDFSFPSALHVGRITHPIAWVLGERQRVSGRELLVAVVVGYDVACRLVPPQLLRDYLHLPQSAVTPLAAAAVAARLLRHDRARTTHAIAYAAHLGAGLVEDNDVMTSGVVARNGTLAALLAQPRTDQLRTIEGPRGLFATWFGVDARDVEPALASLGREFAIMGTSTKRFPGSASHILALEFTRELLTRAAASADDIAGLVVTLSEDFRGRFEYMERRIDLPDPTEHDVSHSLRAKLALLLAHGGIVYQPTRAHFDDPAVRAALAKVSLRFEPARSLDYGRVRLSLSDGRVLEREGLVQPYPKGDWSAWLREGGERYLSAAQISKLERLLTHLEEVEDVADVMACVRPD